MQKLLVITFHLLIIFISCPSVEVFQAAYCFEYKIMGWILPLVMKQGEVEFDHKKAMLGIRRLDKNYAGWGLL